MKAPFPDIETLLPHRGRMRLVEKILSLTETQATAMAKVRESWPLVSGGKVPPMMLIELLAQTSGLCNGLSRIRERGIDSDKSGWIVGIKEAQILIETLSVGEIVVCEAKNRFVFEDFREVAGIARIGETIAAQGVLQLIRGKNSSEEKT
jgi:predicted hotdog family 3-hydroxylacyl-ACP dehydratase